jgi:serine/threonine-protein kinase
MEVRLLLDRYEVIRPLGAGGMGRVYLARQRDTGRLVVVKVLHEHLAPVPRYREAFRQEIDFMSRFRHPNALELYEASLDGPHPPCAVMEYVDGLPLDDLLQRAGCLPARRVGRLLGRLCSVLQAAHDQGIIHRDLKPANIMVLAADTPGEDIKVLDFGLARLAPAPSGGLYIPMEKFTRACANAAVGTPSYLCPEQFRGEEVGPRGDLYSVGVILYEMLTGRPPFQGATTDDLLTAHLYEAPPPMACRDGQAIAPAVEKVVRTCLAKDPADRPASARELARLFGAAVGENIWDEEDLPAPLSAAPAVGPAPAEEEDPAAVVYHLEAWMPERIAAIKLRGFLQEIDGEVIESVPGLIRVRLKRPCRPTSPPPARGFLSRLGFGKKPAAPEYELIEMDVAMGGPAAERQNRLPITVRLRPNNRGRVADEWLAWCEGIQSSLSAYLMAQRL